MQLLWTLASLSNGVSYSFDFYSVLFFRACGCGRFLWTWSIQFITCFLQNQTVRLLHHTIHCIYYLSLSFLDYINYTLTCEVWILKKKKKFSKKNLWSMNYNASSSYIIYTLSFMFLLTSGHRKFCLGLLVWFVMSRFVCGFWLYRLYCL